MIRHRLLTVSALTLTLAGGVALAHTARYAPVSDWRTQEGMSEPLDGYTAAFDAWLSQGRPDTAILVIRRGGRTVYARGLGADAFGPTLIGSMSKAITGACVATLIRDRKLTFDTPMRVALANFFERYGRPLDPRFEHVTVEQLLVHRSGLLGNEERDPIHFIRRARTAQGLQHVADPQPLLAEHLQDHPLAYEPGTEFSYSNTGYVALTAVIEEAAGQPFEDYCRAAVFAPLGIPNAKLHPEWRMLGGSGGWFISGPDYLKFLEIFDPSHPFLGETAKAWIGAARTRFGAEGRGWYSLGVYTVVRGGGWTVSHSGRLNSRGKDANGQPNAAVVSSFAVRDESGCGIFIAVTPATRLGATFADLRRAIARVQREAGLSS
jgi:CubicO group peptidase (beta-lactamase class C family)